MITRSTPRAALALIAMGLVLAGCHSPSRGGRPGPLVTESPSPSPDKQGVAKRDALAAYTGMWNAFAQAGQVPDPDAPDLRRYAAGDALKRIVGVLVVYRDQGVVTQGGPTDYPSVTSAVPADAPTEVDVVDCGDSTNWTKHKKATGELIQNDPRGRRHITAVVKLTDGLWKVNTFDVGDIGSC